MGFLVFGTVIDKRRLAGIAASLLSVAGTVLTTLYALADI